MAFPDPREPLEHILDAPREIESFTAGRTLQDYLREGWLRFATQRGIEIASEASRRIPDDLKAGRPEIPWQDIAAIGNILRHGYDSLDHEMIWCGRDSFAAVQGDGREHAAGRREPDKRPGVSFIGSAQAA